jgi:hypothetical protein
MEKHGLSKYKLCGTIDTDMSVVCGTANIYSGYARSAEKKSGPQERENRIMKKYLSVYYV